MSVTDSRFLKNGTEAGRSGGGRVPGRKAAGKDSKVENDERLYELFEEAYRGFVKAVNKYDYTESSRRRPTLRNAYDVMIMRHFSSIDPEKGGFVLFPEEERPSYQRFRRYVCNVLLNGGTIKSASASARDKRNNRRLLVGTNDYGVYNPMEMVEIDETEPSVQLISANPYNPNQTIGNGVTYIAVDVVTRRIVGASVSLTNNSYEGFLNLMDSMMMTDEENAEILGVELDPEKPVFPGCKLPREIRVDHGAEYTSHTIKDNLTGGKEYGMIEGVPIAINLVPVAMGSLKGVVERFFGELDTRVRYAVDHGMGYVTQTYRSGHMKEACMNIEDYRKILYEMIKKHNNTVMADYPMTPELRSQVEEPTPNNLWDYLIEEGGRLSGFDVSDDNMRIAARYGLMKRSDDFMLSRRQISYRNVLYWDIGDDEDMFHRAIVLGNKKERIRNIRFDPRAVDCLYKLGDDGVIRTYSLAKKRTNMAAFSGFRWADIDLWITEHNSKRHKALRKREDENIMTEYKIKRIAEDAKYTKADGELITKNKKEARQFERAALNAYDMKKRNEIFYGKKKELPDDEYEADDEYELDYDYPEDDEYPVFDEEDRDDDDLYNDIDEDEPDDDDEDGPDDEKENTGGFFGRVFDKPVKDFKAGDIIPDVYGEVPLEEIELPDELLAQIHDEEGLMKAKEMTAKGINILTILAANKW